MAFDIPKFSASDPLWFTREDVAILIGRDVSRVDAIRRAYGHKCDHGRGKTLRVYAPAIVAAIRRTQTDAAKRLKRAQAAIAQEKLKRLRGEVVSVDDIRADIDVFASGIREGIERLCRSCQELMSDTITEIDRAWQSAMDAAESDDDEPSVIAYKAAK